MGERSLYTVADLVERLLRLRAGRLDAKLVPFGIAPADCEEDEHSDEGPLAFFGVVHGLLRDFR